MEKQKIEIIKDNRYNTYEVFLSELDKNYNEYNNFLGVFNETELTEFIKNKKVV